MRYHEYRPHRILQDTVKCFWIHEATHRSETTQEITPDGCVELIFNFGSPYRLLTTTPPTPLPGAVIVGFQDKTFSIRMRGTVKVVAARLFAWGALALLQDDIGALTGTMSPPGKDLDALVRTYARKVIQAAAKLLHRTKGQYGVSELADYCHLSVRQLERGFRHVVGTSPKTFARTLRFQEAQRRLMFDPDADLTALAYDCGYFDQAHFIKDFKAFAGKTPSEYARAMLKMQEVLKDRNVVFLPSPSRQDE